MSKSLGNFFTIDDITKRGIYPLAFRLLLLQSHYRQPMNFTWKALEGAQEAYMKLKAQSKKLKAETNNIPVIPTEVGNQYKNQFIEFIESDLQTPQALATLFTMLKSELSAEEKVRLVGEFDKVLGLDLLTEEVEIVIPQDIRDLADARKKAKLNKEYSKADDLRKQIETKGYKVEDAKGEYRIVKL